MSEQYSSIQAGWEFMAVLSDENYTQVDYPPCTGPLKEVFEREPIGPNLPVRLVVPDSELLASVSRYQSRGPGNEAIRMFFSNPRATNLRQVVLTLSPRRFEIGATIDVTREPIPSCDYGEEGIGNPEEAIMVRKKDLSNAVKEGNREVRAKIFGMIDRRSIRECPIYSRPVYDPPSVQLPGGGTGAETESDWSIREVRAFSQQGLLSIMNELDPAGGDPARNVSRSKPIVLRPSLRPAVEIAELVVDNLTA